MISTNNFVKYEDLLTIYEYDEEANKIENNRRIY